VTKQQATQLMGLLASAYPDATVEPETVAVYVKKLSELNRADTAEKAINQLIDHEKKLPSIAEIRVAYLALRRREEEAAARAIPPPAEEIPRRELPAVARELLDRWSVPDESEALPDAGHGRCDDCAGDHPRVTVGRFALCHACARSRLRVQAQLSA
jgi:hypothetical protein